MKREQEVMEIDLLQLAKALWHRAWAIILAMLIFGSAGYSYAYFLITPLYQASAMLYVNNSSFSVGSTSVNVSDLSAAKSLVDTYVVILKTRSTLNDVIDRAELNYSSSQLANMISAGAVNSTEVLEIVVTSSDPYEAEKIANIICEVLPERISDIVEGTSVRIVDYAVAPSVKSSPSLTHYASMGLLLGLVFSCGLIVLLELLDEQIRDEEYLLQTYDLPILTVVPEPTRKSKSAKGYYSYGGEEVQKK